MGILASLKKRIKEKKTKKLGLNYGTGCVFLCGDGGFGSEPYLITIGDNCVISTGVLFSTHEGATSVINHKFGLKHAHLFGEIHVGSNVFIGHGATILYGTSIGDNVIIGAGAVVANNIPSDVVAAGVPAKVICSIDEFYAKHKSELIFDIDKNTPAAKKRSIIEKTIEKKKN